MDIAAQLIRLLLVWTIKIVGGSDPTTVDIATDSRTTRSAQWPQSGAKTFLSQA